MSWGVEACLSDAECGWSESCGPESECSSSDSMASSDAGGSSSSSAASFSTCPSTRAPPRSSSNSSPKAKRLRSSPTSSNSSRRYLSDKLIHPSPIPPRRREAAESRKRAVRSELGAGERPSALSWPFPALASSELSSVSWIESQLPAPLQVIGVAEKAKYEQQQKLDRWFEGLSAASVEHLMLWEGWVEEAGKVYTPAEVQTVLLDLEARGLLEMGGARGVAERQLRKLAGEREGWLW